MSLETAIRAIDFLLNLHCPEDDVVLDFIGGEPLIKIDLIAAISDYFVAKLERLNHKWKNNYSFRFTTNGILYTRDAVQRYINRYIDKLDIHISIDGNQKKHDMNRVFSDGKGSYNQVISSVNLWLSQFKNRARSMMVISHSDIPYLSQSIIHLIGLGLKDIAITPVVENTWMTGDGFIVEKELIKIADYLIENRLWNDVIISSFHKEIGIPLTDEHIYPCGNPMYVFDSRGDIYSCVRFMPFSLRNKESRKIGDINCGIDFNRLRPLLSFDQESYSSSECMMCEYASFCRWCPAENYDSGEIDSIYLRTTTVCEIHKATSRAKNYYWNQIKLIETNGR